jgi:hypothetical protein
VSPHRIAIRVALALCLSGCGPYLRAASTPPPTRTGDHVVNLFDDDEVKLSRGVAVAFDCVDGFTGRPCEASSISVADKSIARVYPGFLERGSRPMGLRARPAHGVRVGGERGWRDDGLGLLGDRDTHGADRR